MIRFYLKIWNMIVKSSEKKIIMQLEHVAVLLKQKLFLMLGSILKSAYKTP